MEKTKILVADDEELNIKLYQFNLSENGYEVEVANNGKLAVEKARSSSPDTILMDIMMPIMDGLSACKLIKEDDRTKHIPIIIVSAKNSTIDILNGLKAGADEYLTKPFHTEELVLRVRSMVKLKKTLDELKSINSNLENEVKKKTAQLLEASRFELIGKMASGLGHDLNNLLTGIIGYNCLAASADTVETARMLIDKQNKSIELCQNFVKNLINFSKVQKPVLTLFNPKECVETTLGILTNRFRKQSINYKIVEEEKTEIYGDEGQFNQICLNITSNAIDAMPNGGDFVVTIKNDGKYAIVSFTDTGHGIKKNHMDKIFDYLFTTKCPQKSTGIGLYTTKKIVEELNGKIDVISEEGKGAIFNIFLPNRKNMQSEKCN